MQQVLGVLLKLYVDPFLPHNISELSSFYRPSIRRCPPYHRQLQRYHTIIITCYITHTPYPAQLAASPFPLLI